MAYLLDADWVVNSLAGRRRAAEVLGQLAPQGIAVSWITIAEIYEGAFGSSNPDAHLRVFRNFLKPFRILSLNDPIAQKFAEIRSVLRRRGQLISDFDILLGATALQYDLTVLTFNVQHLRRIPELRVYSQDDRPSRMRS